MISANVAAKAAAIATARKDAITDVPEVEPTGLASHLTMTSKSATENWATVAAIRVKPPAAVKEFKPYRTLNVKVPMLLHNEE